MKHIKVNIINSNGDRTSTTVNARVAQTYVKLVHGTANEEQCVEDVIKAIQTLAQNGRDNIPAPTSQDELTDLMMKSIESNYYGCWHALQSCIEPPKGYVPTKETLKIQAENIKQRNKR